MPSRSDNPPRIRTTPLLGGLMLALLGILLVLQASGIWNVIQVDTASDTLLLYGISTLTFVAFIIFAFIFLRSLFKLTRERRAQELGSKLKSRLMVHFFAVSILPIMAMAVFSYLFFNRSIEKWFSRIPEEAIQSARRVQINAAGAQFHALEEKARLLAAVYAGDTAALTPGLLEKLRQEGNLTALVVLDKNNQPVARAVAAQRREEVDETLALALRTGGKGPPLRDGKDLDAVLTVLADGSQLLAVSGPHSPTPDSITIERSAFKLDDLKMEQRKVRRLGLLALALLTLLLLFASAWIALYLGRNIATPIMDLVKASGEVAKGNLSYRVKTRAEDEVALLAQSFNQMTVQLGENRRELVAKAAELHKTNQALHERREYIETVLESSSAGVISFDEQNRVTTLNIAAQTMLRARPDAEKLADILAGEDLAALQRLLARARRMGRATEQTVLARGRAHDGETVPVSLAATALAGDNEKRRGVVLVIEDLTDLLAAQRAAAWSEVARRLAHEIKNPLTPIQLSAERIAKNFVKHGNGANNGDLGRVVQECTTIIKREVVGLKDLVDEFSRFARLPHARLEPADLNEVVRQSLALYEDRLEGTQLEVSLASDLPVAALDSEQIRRVLVNLIENALEAMAGQESPRRLTVTTSYDAARAQLCVEVSDTGHGIAPSHFARLFQPYFSTRGRGTGLGLAIVQRIITEHGGRIRASRNQPQGARFMVELPA
jgi:PAS domain S-box-containing protein